MALPNGLALPPNHQPPETPGRGAAFQQGERRFGRLSEHLGRLSEMAEVAIPSWWRFTPHLDVPGS